MQPRLLVVVLEDIDADDALDLINEKHHTHAAMTRGLEPGDAMMATAESIAEATMDILAEYINENADSPQDYKAAVSAIKSAARNLK